MTKITCVVAGCGVVGLTCTRALSLAGIEVLAIEKNLQIGLETSSRNSGVIHAGLYYRTNSQKAKLCVEGRREIYKIIRDNNIPFSNCGKILLATTEEEVHKLNKLSEQGQLNGVEGLKQLSSSDVHYLEPEVNCKKALLSETTGILDTTSFMSYCEHDAERNGAMFVLDCTILSVKAIGNISSSLGAGEPNFIVETSQGPIQCEYFINCAGLHAPFLASKISNYPSNRVPRAYYAKGNYFKLSSHVKTPFKHLIYPIPPPGGLGVHATLGLDNSVKFGPDVEWLRQENTDIGMII